MIKKIFSPYSKPYPPNKPRKKVKKSVFINEINIGNYGKISLTEELKKADYIYCEADIDRDEYANNIKLSFSTETEVDNEEYGQQLKEYKNKYLEYKRQLKEWEELKIKYNQEEEKKILKQKKQLKKELDG